MSQNPVIRSRWTTNTDGTSINGSTLTALPASQLTGALPAISGAALTAIPTVPLTSGVSGTLPIANGGTGVSFTGAAPFYQISSSYSNASPDFTTFYVHGSSFSWLNGVYKFSWTNSGSQEAVWTNTTGSTNGIIYQNDSLGGTLVETITNDPNYFYLSGVNTPPFPLNGNWGPANATPGTDNLYVTPGTNYSFLSSGNLLGNSNTFFVKNPSSVTNMVWVDYTIGNDTNIFTFGAPIQTISNACKSPLIAGGGVMNIAPGIDPETNSAFIPPNVVVNAWGTVLTGPGGENGVSVGNPIFNISQGDTINGLTMTNGNIYTPVQNAYPGEIDYPQNVTLNNCHCYSGIDGLVLWNIGQGFRDFNGDYRSHWDAVYIGGSPTNATIEFHQPYMEVIAPPFGGAPNTTGMHGIVLFGETGKLEIWGGTIVCLGSTNKASTAPNGCIALMASSTTMSIVLHGTTFIYGSTNSGVTVSPIAYASGVAAINVSGDYYDQTNVTGNLYETNMTVKHVYLNSSINVPTIVIGNSTNTASFTLTQTNFISGQLYTNLTGRPILVSANATLTLAAVSGYASMELLASGYLTNSSGMNSSASTIAESYTNTLSMFIPAGQKYTFTNLSSGSGNSAAVLGGQLMVY